MKRMNLASRQQHNRTRNNNRIHTNNAKTLDIPLDDTDLDDILNNDTNPNSQEQSIDTFLSEITSSVNNEDTGTIISKAITLGTIHEDKSDIISTNNNDNKTNEKVATKTFDDTASFNGSVFTEKKQDDIDRLFDDLLGPSRGSKKNDYEDVSVASSAMSSVMPVITTGTTRYRNNKRRNNENGLISRRINDDSQSMNNDDESTYYTLFSSSVRKGKQKSDDSIMSSTSDVYSINEYIKRDTVNSNASLASVSLQSFQTKTTMDDGTVGTMMTNATGVPIEERFYKLYAERRKRMLHLRAAFTLFILVAIMFAIVQFTSVNTYNAMELKTLRQEYQYHTISNKNNFKGDVGEEGLDRPLRANQMIGLNQRASSSGLGRMSSDAGKKKFSMDNSPSNASPVDGANTNNGPVDLLFTTPQDQQQTQKQEEVDNSKPTSIQMPESFANYADVSKPDANSIDIPILWQVPMAGAKTIRDILSYCLESTLACEMGSKGAYSSDNQLEVFTMNDAKFINVDTTYIKGIERAKLLKVVQSPLVNVFVTPYIHEASTMFSPSHQGRVFAMLRHPIFRAASTFQFLKKTDAVVATWSLVQYASSDRIENNWMTRFLSNHHSGEVTMEHLILAKEILRTKVLIGLEDNNWVSLKRFEKYFNWEYTKEPTKQFECRKKFLIKREEAFDYKIKNEEQVVKEGSQIWTLILWQNKFDMKLYQYAEKLFEEQGKLFPGIPLK